MKETMQAICDALNKKRGQFGFVIVTETEPTMRKTNNPFIGRVTKRTTITDPMLGASYENMVNNRIERTTEQTNPDYKAIKPTGKHYFNEWCDQSDKDEKTFYLRIGTTKATKRISQFFVDGREATSNEIDTIKQFLPTKKPCQKQVDAGLSEKDVVQWETVKVCNVKEIWQGKSNRIF